MKVYIEEIEDMNTHGVTYYSLVQGMNIYMAEVRASGIEIVERNLDTGSETPVDNKSHLYSELVEALTELYKEGKDEETK